MINIYQFIPYIFRLTNFLSRKIASLQNKDNFKSQVNETFFSILKNPYIAL